jgi:hypothetical protein
MYSYDFSVTSFLQIQNDILALRAEHNGARLKARDHVKILKGEKWQYIKENYGDYIATTTDTQSQKKKFIQMVARLFALPTNSHGGKRHGVSNILYIFSDSC